MQAPVSADGSGLMLGMTLNCDFRCKMLSMNKLGHEEDAEVCVCRAGVGEQTRSLEFQDQQTPI